MRPINITDLIEKSNNCQEFQSLVMDEVDNRLREEKVKTTREKLKEVFKTAKENKTDIYIAVTIPGQNDVEYIVNKNRSLDNKLEYYCKAYDEDCVHAMNNQIRIVDAGCIDFYMGE